VPLRFEPGEAYQFDWSHEVVLIDGVTVTVKVAHVRLCHNRRIFVRAYPRETQEMAFDAHDRAFAFLKGACTRGIYDSETLFAIGSRTMVERRLRCVHLTFFPCYSGEGGTRHGTIIDRDEAAEAGCRHEAGAAAPERAGTGEGAWATSPRRAASGAWTGPASTNGSGGSRRRASRG
jgi:hypothetical protein